MNYQTILEENPCGVFATINNGEIETRIFQFLFIVDKKIYFCTENDKPVCEQLKKNSHVNFCTFGSSFSPVLSIKGNVHFDSQNMILKQRVLDENPPLKKMFQIIENPLFELIYIEVAEYTTYSIAEGKHTTNPLI